jgi:hypothetical protein
MRLFRALFPLVVAVGAGLAVGQGRPSLEKVLHRWIQSYEKNDLQLAELAVVRGKVDPIYGKGWITGVLLDATHRVGLAVLLDRATKKPTVPLAQEIIRLTAMGLLDGKATLYRPHYAVRHLGKIALSRCTSTDCMFFLMQVADGDMSAFRKRPKDAAGFRAAAIFALGSMDKPVVRPTLQKQLRAEDRIVRLATAEALEQMRHPRSLDDLAAAMRVETDPIVAQALVRSVKSVLALHGKEVDKRQLQAVVQSAVRLSGRTDWRADLEIVELFVNLRSAGSIPALISILENATGSSHRLREAAGDALKSLTGAILPVSEPAKWREYWKGVQDTFVVAPAKKLGATRTAAGFFGLPVRGSNVVFIIDTSGSMQTAFFAAGDYEPDELEPDQTRLRVAKLELLKAVKGMSGDSKFNLVSFATEVKPWRKKLVLATKNTRSGLVQAIQKMRPVGATNIFGALETALGIKTLQYGARYETPVDEVFLLSDGEPTAGKVVDTVTILQLIEETNRYSKVRINTIYMGGGGGSVFMELLATQNGGRYVRL